MPKGYHRDVKAAPEHPPPRAQHFAVGPPEGQAWFQRLSPAAQEEFRARWKAGDVLDAKRDALAQNTLKRSIAQATLVFFVNETACAMPSIWHSLAAIVVGVALGAYWHRIAAGRFLCMTTSIAPYVALRLVFALTDGGADFAWTAVYAILGFLTILCLTGLVGVVREGRRSDALDH